MAARSGSSRNLPNGWQAIADPNAPFASAQVIASSEKLEKARQILEVSDDIISFDLLKEIVNKK